MNQSPVTEPSIIIISMSLTALSATYIDFYKLDSISGAERVIFAAIIFFLAGISSSQLYVSLIIPKLRDQINFPMVQERSTKQNFFVRYLGFYLQMTTRFFKARCNVREIRLLGYLNGLAAFSLLFFVQLIYILEKSFSIVIVMSKFR